MTAPRSNPSLGRRLLWRVIAMAAGVCVIGGVGLLGLNTLHQNLGSALDGYDQLRRLYEAGVPTLSARDALEQPAHDTARAIALLDVARVRIDSTSAGSADVRRRVLAAIEIIRAPTVIAGDRLNAINSVLGAIAHASIDIRQRIADDRAAAEQDRRRAIAIIAAASVAVAGIVMLVGINLYRIVLGPVAAVAAAARRLAEGRWDERVTPPRSAELAALAGDFNQMAAELADLHYHMEAKVLAQSEQLARSQRLASVGFLAAGVAHEINNPLGIIVGYGERSMRKLQALADEPNVEQARDAIRVMCDEAFRCRTITDRLLSLSRGDDEAQRTVVSLASVWRDAVADLSADRAFARCVFVVETQPGDEAEIVAEAGQMRQLALNLLTNAAEAGGERPCRVEVRLSHRDEFIEIDVADDGVGMTGDTVRQVFEPFFTTRRGSRPGTGLGLSIAHGIVTGHGGSIAAHSDGPGRGSRFTLRLPAAAVPA